MGGRGVSENPRRSAAVLGLVRDPALFGGPRVALPAENRYFPDAKSRERRQLPIPRLAAVHA